LLGRDFVYEIGREQLTLAQDLTQEKLVRFVRKDRANLYSGIFKQYEPHDPALNESRIGDEMIENLKLLYPLYNFMAYRFRAN
jgi:hypothetical protein